MNDPPPPPSRPLKAYAVVAKGALWLLLAAWLVLVLAWGALHGWIVPRIGELRPDLEIEAGRVLGVPVRIGSISARSEGLFPSFDLQDVVLLDPQGRPALRLPRVLAALSPRSLWNLGFEQLYIDSPELDVRRAWDGRVFIAGLDFSGADASGGSRAADWFFRQTEFVIRNGTVRWTDEMRGAPPLALNQVEFVMRNTVRRHSLRLDATPPVEWGERFTLRGLFRQPLLTVHDGRWQDWDGQLHGDFSRVDVTQLRRYADVGVEIAAGHGAVRAWADIEKGQIVGGVADLVLADVNATLGRQLLPLALRSISGRIGGKLLATGFEVHTQGLQFETREGELWPGGNVFLRWTDADGRRLAQGELRADRLDLFALSQIASRLPIGDATHAALAGYAPKGLIETVQAKWQGPLDALQQYEAKGRVAGLEVAARPGAPARAGTPGVRAAGVDFELGQAGGKARVRVHQGAVDFPGVFEDPVIRIDDLVADVQWQIDGQAITASVNNLKFSNADAQGEGQGSWRTGAAAARLPGYLDLQASISHADGSKVYRYLPLGVPKTARDYVRDSVLQGTATGAKFRVKGDLREFPFKEARQGEFRITADVHDVTYGFVPPSLSRAAGNWPALTQLGGQLVFERNGMQVKGATGRFSGAPALQVKVEAQIPDFRTTVVAVTGEVRGALAQALDIVNKSPVSSMIGQALAKASGSGNTEVRLKLSLPVATIDRSKVQGSVTLAGNDVQITPDTPVLARSRGVVNFTEAGFALVGTQARALGGEVRLEGGSRGVTTMAMPPGPDATIALRAQGNATAEGLRQARELGFVSRLARDATGGAAYNLGIVFRRGLPEVTVTSSLQGLALNLPAPLAKPADQAMPLRYENVLVRDAAGGPGRLQDQLTAELGRLGSIFYVRDVSGAQPRVIRGSIALGLAPGESASLPEQGVMANINLTGVNVDAWGEVLSRAAGTAPGGPGGAANAGGAPAARAGPASAVAGYLPTVLAVRARELTVEGRTLHNVVVGGSREGLLWRANVDAAELNGFVEYRQPAGAGGGRLYARLARLSVAAAAANEVENLLDAQPDNLPALDIVVDDFDLRGKKLGHLEIDAVNRGPGAVAREGGVREWRLNKLNLTTPEAVFNATGNWAALNEQPAAPGGPRPPRVGAERRRTAMNFKLDIADSGLLLARFGMKDVVRRGRGRMEGQVAWLGSPLSLDYPSMSGSFFINVEAGQFLKADPGLAKLLGVLSLQSLPRRLALDFRDVFTEGFSFDFVRGDITIQQGIAATNNLQMKGVNAAVLMEGEADIAKETQDLKVVVIPEINAGTASLVATMINPAIGLGSFLAQMFLRQPLMRAATQEFHIDGTWANPRIARISRQLPAIGRPDTEGRPEIARQKPTVEQVK